MTTLRRTTYLAKPLSSIVHTVYVLLQAIGVSLSPFTVPARGLITDDLFFCHTLALTDS
jgi:hypothetical protein